MQLRRCFFAVAAASVAALCVVQGLHDVFNISSGSCRSRQYAVDESIKRAGGISTANEYAQIMYRGDVIMQVLSLVLGG